MTMHKALHPIDGIDKLYKTSKEREIASIEDCVDRSIQGMEKNVSKNKDRLIIIFTKPSAQAGYDTKSILSGV